MSLETVIFTEVISNLSKWVYTKSFETLKNISDNRKYLEFKPINKIDYPEYLKRNFKASYNWAVNVSIRDSITSKDLDQIFVTTDLFLTPRKLHTDNEAIDNKISFNELFEKSENSIVLLGQPGAGKTTSVKKLFVDYYHRKQDVLKQFNHVLLIQLKNLGDKTFTEIDIIKEIFASAGMFYSLDTQDGSREEKKIILYDLLIDFLESTGTLLILDGYDEVNSIKTQRNIIKCLRTLSVNISRSKFLITSRSADFDYYVDNTDEFEICALSVEQVENFIANWLRNKDEVADLLSQLKHSPYWDTAISPLNLAHLCALYERNKSIPEKPKSVYKKIILLLLEDWSNQHSVKRKSKYAGFTPDRKMDFLSRFAYELTVVCAEHTFSSGMTKMIYEVICEDYGLPRNESKYVIKEIESHSGIIMQTGVDLSLIHI